MIPTTRTQFPEDGRLVPVLALVGSDPKAKGYRRRSIVGNASETDEAANSGGLTTRTN
jgi:hypothetical protein